MASLKARLAFHVNTSQVIFYQMLHRAQSANRLAHCGFASGLVIWSVAVWRERFHISAYPRLWPFRRLAALSFIAWYQSVSDGTALTLALRWAFPREQESPSWSKRRTCVLFLLLMLPAPSLLMRLAPHRSASITAAWWLESSGCEVLCLLAFGAQHRASIRPVGIPSRHSRIRCVKGILPETIRNLPGGSRSIIRGKVRERVRGKKSCKG